jgi:isopentenyl diphosphate isomerase/L-lactate dehydrogenase-like FMN-dependent dehydrogenase
LPRAAFDYVDGGAGSGETMHANRLAFREVTLRPHGTVQVAVIDIATT